MVWRNEMNTVLMRTLLAGGLIWALGACSPEVGSKAWCEDMQEKPKGEWTANEAGDYAKHCLLNQ